MLPVSGENPQRPKWKIPDPLSGIDFDGWNGSPSYNFDDFGLLLFEGGRCRGVGPSRPNKYIDLTFAKIGPLMEILK